MSDKAQQTNREKARITSCDMLKAIQLIEDPSKWVQGVYADLNPSTGEKRYCMIGALTTVITERTGSWAYITHAREDLKRFIPLAESFNDTNTHEQVIRKMKEVADALAKEEIKEGKQNDLT